MLSIETLSDPTEASSVVVSVEQAANNTVADRLNKLNTIFLRLISIHPFYTGKNNFYPKGNRLMNYKAMKPKVIATIVLFNHSYDDIKDKLPPYMKGYFDAAMAAQMEIYGDSIFDKVLTVDILEKLCELIDFKQDERAFSDIALVFSSTFLGFKLANIERVQILNKLAKHFPTDLYTDDPDKELIGVNLKGAVNYMTDMPKVFNCSRINIYKFFFYFIKK